MRTTIHLCLVAAVVVAAGRPADAALVVDTTSTARQDVTSALLGGTVTLNAPGAAQYTFDLPAGTASVTALFQGTDLPDPTAPGTFASYDLYNTTTAGTVTQNPGGTFDAVFDLLFELEITSGALAGTVFETLQAARFEALGLPSLVFPPGTTFFDTTPPDDLVLFVKSDPSGILTANGAPVGAPAATSANRVVTAITVSATPEPGSLVLLALVASGGGVAAWRKRKPAA